MIPLHLSVRIKNHIAPNIKRSMVETLNNTTLPELNIHVYKLFWFECQGPSFDITQIIPNLHNQSKHFFELKIIPARDPKQCGGTPGIKHSIVDDNVRAC